MPNRRSAQARLRMSTSMPSSTHAGQPATPVIETLRGLLLDTPIGASPWRAIAWCSGILLASLAISGALFARRTA